MIRSNFRSEAWGKMADINLYLQNMVMIKKIPLFSLLDDKQLSVVAEVIEKKEFSSQEWIFKEGQMGTFLYILLEGTIDLTSARTPGAIRVTPVSSFGEISILDDQEYPYGAKSVDNCRVYRINKVNFSYIIQSAPKMNQSIAWSLFQQLIPIKNRVLHQYANN